MELVEEGDVSNFVGNLQDDQELARALMALLGSICTDATVLWVRAQVDGGSRHDGLQLGHGLEQRFALTQQLTPVGLLGRTMAWPTNEAIARVELPTCESVIQTFETRSGQALSDVRKFGFLRTNLGSTIKSRTCSMTISQYVS